MRRRLMLLWTSVVLVLALLLPAATMAGGLGHYKWKVLSNHCKAGYDPYFKAKFTEVGYTSSNYLTIDSWVQRKPLGDGGGSWSTFYTFNQQTYGPYEDGAGNHWIKAWRTYDGDSSYWYRIQFQLTAWYNDQYLYSKVLSSVKC